MVDPRAYTLATGLFGEGTTVVGNNGMRYVLAQVARNKFIWLDGFNRREDGQVLEGVKKMHGITLEQIFDSLDDLPGDTLQIDGRPYTANDAVLHPVQQPVQQPGEPEGQPVGQVDMAKCDECPEADDECCEGDRAVKAFLVVPIEVWVEGSV